MKLTFDVPEEMAEKIAEDIKVALEEYKKQIWPQVGDGYYFVLSNGSISQDCYAECPSDRARLEFGNIFKTFEEAEFKAEQLRVLHELEQLADDDQPWNENLRHYAIYYRHEQNTITCECWVTYQYLPNIYYFKSKESAEAAIDKIGEDRLKKYYFCIPENKNE